MPGPRVYSSGPFLSQTGGHFDLDPSAQYISPYFTGVPYRTTLFGWVYLADGVAEVQKASREILRTGAAQIKIATGAGLASLWDPLHQWQYTPEEVAAIVYEAKKMDTYVMAHSFHPEGTRIAVEAGVRSIEHGYNTDDETLRAMVEKNVFLATQFYLYSGADVTEMGFPPRRPAAAGHRGGAVQLRRSVPAREGGRREDAVLDRSLRRTRDAGAAIARVHLSRGVFHASRNPRAGHVDGRGASRL